MAQRFQQKAIGWKAAFPTSMAVAFVWWLVGAGSIVSLVTCAATVYLLVELNNVWAILNRRTTLHASIYLWLWAACPFINLQMEAGIVTLVLTAATYLLFRCYQVSECVTQTCSLFLLIGAASLMFPPILCYVPLLYLSLLVYKALTPRTLCAGIVGLLLPYWMLTAYAFYAGSAEVLQAVFKDTPVLWLSGYQEVSVYQWVSLGLVLVFLIVSASYCLMKSYLDKIRTRAHLRFFIWFEVVSLGLTFLFPASFNTWLATMFVPCCLLTGHLFCLSSTRAANIFFIASIILLLLITICNLWMPSYNFF